MDPYQVLGVSPVASQDEIRRAYRELVRRHHPDLHARTPKSFAEAEERMKQINAAYRQVLSGQAAHPAEPEPAPPPPPPRGQPPRPRPPICPRHLADMVYRCARCGRLACVRCLEGQGCRQCRDRRPASFPVTIPEAVWLWMPVLLGAAAVRAWNLPAAAVGWSAIGYLALLGLGMLRRWRWGCLLWLAFPYSVVLAGLWRLLKSLG